MLSEDLPRGPVERADVFLVLLPDGVRARGEADQRALPGRLAGRLADAVQRRCGDELVDHAADPVGRNFAVRFAHGSLLWVWVVRCPGLPPLSGGADHTRARPRWQQTTPHSLTSLRFCSGASWAWGVNAAR